jgi:hypothetical protein
LERFYVSKYNCIIALRKPSYGMIFSYNILFDSFTLLRAARHDSNSITSDGSGGLIFIIIAVGWDWIPWYLCCKWAHCNSSRWQLKGNGAFVWMIITRGNQITRRETSRTTVVHFKPIWVPWDWIQTSAVRSRRLTAWTMARHGELMVISKLFHDVKRRNFLEIVKLCVDFNYCTIILICFQIIIILLLIVLPNSLKISLTFITELENNIIFYRIRIFHRIQLWLF